MALTHLPHVILVGITSPADAAGAATGSECVCRLDENISWMEDNMLGSHQIEIGNNRIRYNFTIHRNITVIRGESATGKTTLIQLLQLYENRGSSSGIDLHCDKNCTVLSETRWQENLAAIHDSIVFVEEGNNFILSQNFADAVAASDNYYVLITRESISNLPYSVTEIYGLRLAGRYGGLKPAYNELYHLYPAQQSSHQIDMLLTEDSQSGYQFFAAARKDDIDCVSAGGNSNISALIPQYAGRNILVIADGAAFGAAMNKIDMLLRNHYSFQLFLPESFEWLLLSSSLFNKGRTAEILQDPSPYIDSQKYLSWERYFTALLIEITQKTYLQYSKQRINAAYLQGQAFQQIIQGLPDNLRECLKSAANQKGETPDADN